MDLPESMRAWLVKVPGPVRQSRPLVARTLATPRPGPREVLVRVEVCAVCRTDLHLTEGDLPPKHPGMAPGHEVVGTVVDKGSEATRFSIGSRLGIAWLRETCGRCRYCVRGSENLCPYSRYTGWDAHGGFAEYAVIREDYAYELPAGYSDDQLGPLLCAGIIGFRALRRAEVPPEGGLGLYGFGASAHLALQVALAEGARVHVLTRSAAARELALELGATSVGEAYAVPPEPLDAAILFAPVGDLVPPALAALDRGGTLAIAGIHLTDIPVLNYERHLFQERTLRSVTANTRQDGEEFLKLAERHRLRIVTTPYAFDRADQALRDLAADAVHGAAVLHMP
jgi:alcohol dehydrogenase, propanol-preferring